MSLLEDKSIPRSKALQAAATGSTIIFTIAYVLHIVSYELELHFHIFNNTVTEDMAEFKAHPGMLVGLLACYPLLAMLGLALVIPLGPYCSEHAAFQDLSVIRPDHHLRLCLKVYSAWMATDGKLSKKDL